MRVKHKVNVNQCVCKSLTNNVIVCQKGSNANGQRKSHFFGWDYNFTRSLCAEIHLWAKIPLYEKDTKQTQIKPMKTTYSFNVLPHTGKTFCVIVTRVYRA